MKSAQELHAQARQLPLVAILRGLTTDVATAIGTALYDAGFRTLEVPLNRPGALECSARLVKHLPADAVVGGGTMLTVKHVDDVLAAGGRLMVSPNCDPVVIRHAVANQMLCAPGVLTPTEAFAALAAGAHALKIFPADMMGHAGLKALRSVLSADTDVWPVGGIVPESIGPWRTAGATGFGIGSQLYTPGKSTEAVAAQAANYVQAWRASV